MGQTTSQPTPPTTVAQENISVASSTSGCPIKHSSDAASRPAKCPVDHSQLNPHNQMPELSQSPAPDQSIALPTAKTESSIPRAHDQKWEYPSPQQFYNALVRKGWVTPEEHIETMVDIHNFLNERAWQEVLKWEKKQHNEVDAVQLARFKGRPGEMSPKARLWLLAGWFMPSRFNTEPPFDRHDWIIRRPHTGEEVRYVIDYYSAPPETDGAPVFSLDVRPALDSFQSVKTRITVATEEAWVKFREESKKPDLKPH